MAFIENLHMFKVSPVSMTLALIDSTVLKDGKFSTCASIGNSEQQSTSDIKKIALHIHFVF